jgi:hypothetical protein
MKSLHFFENHPINTYFCLPNWNLININELAMDRKWWNNSYILYYYIRLYFTVFLLARSNTRDIPFSNILISKKQFLCPLVFILWFSNFMKFSNILISKKQFLCNKKTYCTLVPRNFIHWFCTSAIWLFIYFIIT